MNQHNDVDRVTLSDFVQGAAVALLLSSVLIFIVNFSTIVGALASGNLGSVPVIVWVCICIFIIALATVVTLRGITKNLN